MRLSNTLYTLLVVCLIATSCDDDAENKITPQTPGMVNGEWILESQTLKTDNTTDSWDRLSNSTLNSNIGYYTTTLTMTYDTGSNSLGRAETDVIDKSDGTFVSNKTEDFRTSNDSIYFTTGSTTYAPKYTASSTKLTISQTKTRAELQAWAFDIPNITEVIIPANITTGEITMVYKKQGQ